MNEPEQLDLDFKGPVGDGHANWQWAREQAVRRIASEWGLPLHQRVRLRLTNLDSEFEGVLLLDVLPTRLDRRQPLLLRLDSLRFASPEIEVCTVVG